MKRIEVILMLVLTLITNVLTGVSLQAKVMDTTYINDIRVQEDARNYYVSNEGNDENDGLSPETAWATVEKVNSMTFEPGDRILFHSEGVWTASNEGKVQSFLQPKGSGTAEQPIVIGKYGADDYNKRPIINGAGKVINTVHIQNVNHYVVENLEVTNHDPAGTDYNDRTKELRGIYIENSGISTYTMSNITVQDCYVHNVNARYRNRFNNDGGIIIRVTARAENTTDKALKFDGVYIRRNTVYDVDYGGIFFRNDNQNRGAMGDGIGPWIGSSNVVIENNSLDRIAGDGIVVSTGIAPLVQYNVVKDSHIKCPDPCAAIWVINSDDALFQYNEAYLTRKDNDGQAYDADGLCNNTVFQYNYSHDNEGGFMLICDWHGGSAFNRNGIIRYNISQNDRSKLIHYAGVNTGFKVYNNTFFVGPGNNTTFSRDHGDVNIKSDVEYVNNIFYNLGTNFAYEHPVTDVSFNNNIFYGNHPSSEPHDLNKMTEDPKLFAPGTGETLFGTVVASKDVDRAAEWHSLVNEKLKGYKLMADSPAINGGIPVELPEGIAHATKDFYGNPLVDGKIDIGAHEFSNDEPAPIAKGTAWSFVDNYSDVAGQNNWHYLRFSNNRPLMTTFDSPNSVRVDSQGNPLPRVWRAKQWETEINSSVAYIDKDTLSVPSNEDIGVGFLSPRDGVFNVEGMAKKAISGGDGVKVTIKLNNEILWGPQTIAGDDLTVGQSHDFNVDLNKGDVLYFVVNRKGNNEKDIISWSPTVTYVDTQVTLPEIPVGSYLVDDASQRVKCTEMDAKTYLSENDAYHKTHHLSIGENKGTAEFEFTGTGIEFISQKAPGNGQIRVQLYKDNELIDEEMIETKSQNIVAHFKAYEKQNLEYGNYKIVVSNMGKGLVVDAFIVNTTKEDGSTDVIKINAEYDKTLVRLNFEDTYGETIKEPISLIKGTDVKVSATVLNNNYYMAGFIINGKPYPVSEYTALNVQENMDIKVILNSYNAASTVKLNLSNAEVSSNNAMDGRHAPEVSFDGVTANYQGGWAVQQRTFPLADGTKAPYIQVKLPTNTVINKAKVYFDGNANYRGGTYDIQVSNDGVNFVNAYRQLETILSSVNEHPFPAAKANYVRMVVNSHALSNPENGNFILNELEIYALQEVNADQTALVETVALAEAIDLTGKEEAKVKVFKEILAEAKLFIGDKYVTSEKIGTLVTALNQGIESVKDPVEAFEVALSGTQTVVEGNEVEVVLGVENTQLPVYAQDITITYDNDKVSFVDVTEMDTLTEIVKIETKGNQVRVLLITDKGTVKNPELIKLNFLAKSVTADIKTSIEVVGVEFGLVETGVSSAVEVKGKTHNLTITDSGEVVDKTVLTNKLNQAKALIEQAIVGEAAGNYPQAAVDALQMVINEVEIAGNLATTQEEVDALVESLQVAIDTFKQAQIPEDTNREDINKDGKVDVADLALVAYYYQAKNTDSNWNEAKKADVNNDGEVNTQDLSRVANKVLGLE